VRIAFTVGSRNGITVPSTAVTHRGQLTSVFVVDPQDTARLRLITLGEPQQGRIEVLSGIDSGERVIAQTTEDLRDGVRIRS
jgi:multidrug efflux pump subunit AcrA (membrane-fusion protein)